MEQEGESEFRNEVLKIKNKALVEMRTRGGVPPQLLPEPVDLGSNSRIDGLSAVTGFRNSDILAKVFPAGISNKGYA